MWRLTFTSGSISQRNSQGGTWDSFGGAPDPFVCITLSGDRRCTPAQADTFTPFFNAFVDASAAQLLSGVTVEMLDEDVASNDVICAAGLVRLNESNFAERGGLLTCGTVASLRYTLTPL